MLDLVSNEFGKSARTELPLDPRPAANPQIPVRLSVHESQSHVAVLMTTMNGERYLPTQLDSLLQQTFRNFSIYVADDGSSDGSVGVIEGYKSRSEKIPITCLDGPRQGFVQNFFNLLFRSDIDADYYAFCDQDDVWEPKKLSRAIEKLDACDRNRPALYCGRTLLISEDGEELGFSPLFKRPPCFANALMHNIGGGNTMVMNKAARDLLKEAGPLHVVSHDWWAYMLVSASGGTVIYDPEPTLRYRQHSDNLVGSNQDFRARWRRLMALMRGQLREWNQINIGALNRVRHLISPENQKILDDFSRARNEKFFARLRLFHRSGVYRQTILGTVGLIAALLLKKL